MSNPIDSSARPEPLTDALLLALRLLAAGWAAFFAIGYVLQWVDLLRQRTNFFRDGNAMIFPWIFLPFFASAGLCAGFAIWGVKRMDRMGVYLQMAMALEAAYFIPVILVDLVTNRRPEYPAASKVLAASLLALFIVGVWRSVSVSSAQPWLPAVRTLLSEIPLFLAVIAGSGVIEGVQKAWHDKFEGWGMFTTPVVVVLSVIGASLTIALVWLAWRMQSNWMPTWAARMFPGLRER